MCAEGTQLFFVKPKLPFKKSQSLRKWPLQMVLQMGIASRDGLKRDK